MTASPSTSAAIRAAAEEVAHELDRNALLYSSRGDRALTNDEMVSTIQIGVAILSRWFGKGETERPREVFDAGFAAAPAATSGRPGGERVWHGPADEMPSGVELLAVYRNTFSIGNKHELQMIAHKVEAWCVSRELVASALRAVTAATEQVQCADCLEWIDRDANHTCRQQVRRNQRKAAK